MFNLSRSSHLLCGLLTTGLMVATGCDMTDHDPAGTPEQTLLVLGEGAQSGSPLHRISADFDVLHGDDLGLGKGLMNAHDASQAMIGLHGVGVSLARASDAQLDAWKPLTRAALDAGVPVFIDSIDHQDQVARLIGIGFDAELLMVTSIGPDRHRIRVYGANNFMAKQAGGSDEAVALAPAFAEDVDVGVGEIREQLRSYEPGLVAKSTPANGYEYFELDFSTYNWNITGDQVAVFDLDFEAELVLDSDRGKKNVFFRPIGSGQHPGSLEWDGNSKRGFYQESQKITITPSNTSDVTLYDHAPASPNANSTYTSSTGWTIGVSGADPELSYSASNETTTTLPDFSMINHTSGQVASWTFEMSTDWDDMFNHPAFSKCKVKSLPTLAKSNLKPDFEAIYRSDSSYDGIVHFNFEIETWMRKLWRGGDIFTCKKKTEWWWYTRWQLLSIDFGDV